MASLRFVALCYAIWFASSGGAAAQAVPPSSDAGQVPQRFETPPQPKSLPRIGGIELPSTVAPVDAAKIKLQVARFEITGATVFRATDFADLASALTGKTIPLTDVYALAAAITTRYGDAGYVLSRAIVPPQSLAPKGAVVRIEIVEGYVDAVVWPEGLKERYRDFFSNYAARILESRPTNIKVVERNLLLASDLPGLIFSSTFKPSRRHPKASTLVVSVKEKPFAGEATVDNRGSKGRGPWEVLATATENNLFGEHESLSLKYATAIPSTDQLRFIEGTWRQVLTSDGLTFTFDGSYNSGLPGIGVLQAINYQSQGLLFTANLSYPLIRLRDENMIISGMAFTEDVTSDVLSASFTDDRLRGLRARVDYDRADTLGGISQAQLTVSQGIDGLGSTSNNNPLASRVGGRVDFTKAELLLARTQPLPKLLPGLSTYAAVYGQYAWDPLLTPEQCSYGGSLFGRAYDPSSLIGDNCVTSLLELRYDITIPDNIFSRTQLYAFADHGYVDRVTSSAGTPRDQWGSSAGVGLRLGWREILFGTVEGGKGIAGDLDRDWHTHAALTLRY